MRAEERAMSYENILFEKKTASRTITFNRLNV